MHRETFVHRHLYTQRFYTKKEVFTYRCFVQRCFCAHKKKARRHFYTQNLLPQRSLCTERFLHTDFLAPKKIDTEEIVHTDCAKKNTHRFYCTQKLYPKQFLHSRNSSAQNPLRTIFLKCTTIIADTWFLHRKFSAQKSYAQKVLLTTFFLHTDAFIHRCLYTEDELHTEICAHSTLLHATSFY